MQVLLHARRIRSATLRFLPPIDVPMKIEQNVVVHTPLPNQPTKIGLHSG